jgi:hypothetical protein
MQEGKTWSIEAKATQLGPNGGRDHLTRENETGIPGEELLVQRFLKPKGAIPTVLSLQRASALDGMR